MLNGFLIQGEISSSSKVDYSDAPDTPSLWHCRQICNKYQDCVWVSWNKDESGSGKIIQLLYNHEHAIDCFTRRRMQINDSITYQVELNSL